MADQAGARSEQVWIPPGASDPGGPLQAPAGDGPSGPRASFGQRVGAYLLDGLLIFVLNLILTVALKGAGSGLALLLGIVYYVALEGGPTGQTLGKRALGIRVVDLAGGGQIGYPRAIIRYIGKVISGLAIGIGFLWVIWDREKQGWEDKLATTVVVPVSAFPVPGA